MIQNYFLYDSKENIFTLLPDIKEKKKKKEDFTESQRVLQAIGCRNTFSK